MPNLQDALGKSQSLPTITSLGKANTARHAAELREAIAYMTSNWTSLTHFLAESRAPLSNNADERAMRGPVVGWRNHFDVALAFKVAAE